ncbi:hypothetical protein B0T18DRAFT_348908 [Schizothecium vesticola]|uniref:Enoyl reductase (ER) domain-containing protein n=1 Tax=Schizothecium vesticola TaxID=314040 RepID=A0AA40EWT6_9PEZI|nr:hypothetical protein B0T18DRAFT_348908 [Schizothecium vesticola]
MRAWVYASTTPTLEANLSLSTSAPVPSPAPTQALIRVLAASLNPADYKVPEIGALARLAIPLPATPGMDFCGVVVTPPSTPETETTRLPAGTYVFGRLGTTSHGSLAEYVVAPANAVCALPPGVFDAGTLSPADFAALPVAGLTALQAIAPRVAPGKGDGVFINGGAGGVGTYAIQVAKALGCRVVVTCSKGKAELCRGLGADEVVDYTEVDVVEVLKKGGRGFQLVVDNIAAPTGLYKASEEFLVEGGRFVQVGGGASVGDVSRLVSRMVVPGWLGGGKRAFEFLVLKQSVEDLERLAGWVVEGKVRSAVEDVFEMDKAKEAIVRLKSGRVAGKLVVRIAKE